MALRRIQGGAGEGAVMNVSELIAKLNLEREEIDQAITTLERMAGAQSRKRRARQAKPVQKPRGAPQVGVPPDRPSAP